MIITRITVPALERTLLAAWHPDHLMYLGPHISNQALRPIHRSGALTSEMGVLYSTRYDWSLYLVKEIRDVVDVVVDHHPDVVVCLVRGHLGQRVVLDLVSHFSRKNNTIRTNQKRITVRKFCENLNCART